MPIIFSEQCAKMTTDGGQTWFEVGRLVFGRPGTIADTEVIFVNNRGAPTVRLIKDKQNCILLQLLMEKDGSMN